MDNQHAASFFSCCKCIFFNPYVKIGDKKERKRYDAIDFPFFFKRSCECGTEPIST